MLLPKIVQIESHGTYVYDGSDDEDTGIITFI